MQYITILGDARGYGKRAAAAAIALDWLAAEPHRDLTAADKENVTEHLIDLYGAVLFYLLATPFFY